MNDSELREDSHAYLGAVSRELDCLAVIVGGVADHVHLLARFGRSISQAEWVKEVKRVSSAWIKERSPRLSDFSWQAGYGVFSVSASNLETVRVYIEQQ